MRVVDAFDNERLSMISTAVDYARWDDTERFVAGENPDFIATNFDVESMANIHMTAYVITRTDGRPVASQMLASDGTLMDTSATLLADLQPRLAEAIGSGLKDAETSLFWQKETPYLLSAAPITDSARRHPSSGYMFFLRRLDDAYLDRMRKATSTDFVLIPAPKGHDGQVSVKQYADGSDKRWEARQTWADWPAVIAFGGATTLGEERRATYLTLAINALLLMVISLRDLRDPPRSRAESAERLFPAGRPSPIDA